MALPPQRKISQFEPGGTMSGDEYFPSTKGGANPGYYSGDFPVSLPQQTAIALAVAAANAYTDSRAAVFTSSLAVTVGSGEEYETWDEMYAAVRVMAGGELTINSSDPQDNAQLLYDFSNWAKIIVTTGVNFTASAIVDAPVGSTLAGSAIGTSLLLKGFTFTGAVPVTASFFSWIDCNSGSGTAVNVTASAFFMNGISGAVAQDITSSCEIQTAGDVSLIDVTAPKITCGGGSLQILAATNNSATLVANFTTARNGGSITVNSVDCGANGVTNVFTVDRGTIYAPTSVTGTYTNLYNQNPGSRTEKGVINTAASSKGTLSTLAGQGLSDAEAKGARGNAGLAGTVLATVADVIALSASDNAGRTVFCTESRCAFWANGTDWTQAGVGKFSDAEIVAVISGGTVANFSGLRIHVTDFGGFDAICDGTKFVAQKALRSGGTVAASVTGPAAETNMLSVDLTAIKKYMGTHPQLQSQGLWEFPNSAANKFPRVRISSTSGVTGLSIFGTAATATPGAVCNAVYNFKAANAQFGASAGNAAGGGTGTPVTTTFDLNNPAEGLFLNFTANPSGAGEIMTFTGYGWTFIPGH